MLDELVLKSFKSFIYSKLELSNITVLTGLNSSGKSSVLQAIRMCKLVDKDHSPYIQGFGGFTDLKSKLTSQQKPVQILLSSKEMKNYLYLSLRENINKHRTRIDRFSIEYISADRHGPCVTLPIMPQDIDDITVGEKGEYFADYYSKFESVIIPEKLRHANSTGNTLKHQINHWMGEISPGVDLNFSVTKEQDISHLGVNGFRATNTGFGISYSLPIVLSALVMSSEAPLDSFKQSKMKAWHSNKNKILIIENPEAHLHPKGQTALGLLLAIASSCGAQIIVETHSDHFIDGVRLAVKNVGATLAQKSIIYYFTREKDKDTKIEKIRIKEDGKLTSWPEGFFDQSTINLSKLAKK
ncbi:TPA: DUF3696 domain-containing protein [Escherichia coli]